MIDFEHHHHDQALPRGALWGAVALVVLTVCAAFVTRYFGTAGQSRVEGTVVVSRDLQFRDRADGAVLVFTGTEASPSVVLTPGTNGFVRGVLRGLARERRARGVDPESPFRLTRWADGRVSLEDPATGRTIELRAFGLTNQDAFLRLLTPQGTAQLSGG